MKLVHLISLLACHWTMTLTAQWTDPGSLSGSLGATALYNKLKDEDEKVMKNLKRFETHYAIRQLYLAGSGLITKEINEEANRTRQRYEELKRRNNALSIFSYSYKKENTKLLHLIDASLKNTQHGLSGHRSIHVLYGEKSNLYQSVMQSFTEIHRLLDIVEGNIEQTALYNRFFNN